MTKHEIFVILKNFKICEARFVRDIFYIKLGWVGSKLSLISLVSLGPFITNHEHIFINLAYYITLSDSEFKLNEIKTEINLDQSELIKQIITFSPHVFPVR